MLFSNVAEWAVCILIASVEGRVVPSHPSHNASVRTLYQFPEGTWVENLAVRANGQLLLTLLNLPELYQLDPFAANATPELVHNFTTTTGLSGIAEIAPDVFGVAAGNYSLTTGEAFQGSWSVWSVDFSGGAAPDISKITDVSKAFFINGVCALPFSKDSAGSMEPTKDLLLGDIQTGVIYSLDTSSGSYEVAVNNSLTAAVSDPVFGIAGVDGIHVRDDTLYIANAGQNIFARQPIHANGTPAGEGSIIARTLNSSDYFDDFTLRGSFAYMVTGSGNSIERIALDVSGRESIIAGSLNSTLIAEPTSAAFGRTETDRDVLYVVTAGGLATPVDGDLRIGAQVLAVDLEGC